MPPPRRTPASPPPVSLMGDPEPWGQLGCLLPHQLFCPPGPEAWSVPATGARHACQTKRRAGPGPFLHVVLHLPCTGAAQAFPARSLRQAPWTAVPRGTNAEALNPLRQTHLHLPAPSRVAFPASACLPPTRDVPPVSPWAQTPT